MAEYEHQRSVDEHRRSVEAFIKQLDRLHGRKIYQRVGSKSWRSGHKGLPYTQNHPRRQSRKNSDINFVYEERDLFTTFGNVHVCSEGNNRNPLDSLDTSQGNKSDPLKPLRMAASEPSYMALYVGKKTARYGSRGVHRYPSSPMSSSNESSPTKPSQTEEKASTPLASPTEPRQTAEETSTPQGSPKEPRQTSEKAASTHSSPLLSGRSMPATSMNIPMDEVITTGYMSTSARRTTIKNRRPHKTLNPMKITKAHLKRHGARRPTHHLEELLQKPQAWRSMEMVQQSLNSQYQIVHHEIATSQWDRKKKQSLSARLRRKHSGGKMTKA